MTTPLDPMRGVLGAQPLQPAGAPAGADAARTADGKSFGDVLQDYVKQVDQTQHQVDEAIAAVERGGVDNIHRVMLAQREAEFSLKLAAEVRNKLVDAYKDVMRTQF